MPREPKIRRIDYSPDEFLAGTVELSDAECGLYWRLCTLIYSRGRAVSREELRAVSRSHGNAFNAMLWRLLRLGKVIGNDVDLFVKRCGNELEIAVKRVENARENGAKGGRPSKKTNGLAEPTGLFSAKANHQLPTINHQKEEESPPISPPSRKRATRLPEGWQPNAEERAFAVGRGLDPIETAAQFCDYWQSEGKTKLDWHKTWQVWCRNQRTSNKRPEKLSPVTKMLIGGQRAVERFIAQKTNGNTGDDDDSAFPLLDSRRND